MSDSLNFAERAKYLFSLTYNSKTYIMSLQKYSKHKVSLYIAPISKDILTGEHELEIKYIN